MYVDPNSEAAGWVRSHPDDPRAKSIQDLIADEPTGKWFGAWSGDIASAVAAYTSAAFAAHRVPILVAYNIPDRDCGGQSAGGQSDDAGYDAWINGFANGIAVRPAIVVLEPDVLAEIANCLDTAGQQARYQMLAYAVKALRKPGVRVYLDAGHSNWIPADQMAQRLRAADIAEGAGFALNVSNYDPVTQELTYAAAVNRSLGLTKPFIIDSSRNGSSASPGGNWCNPGAQKLGPTPQTTELGGLLLWIKAPGESDGNCGVGAGTAAGQFSPALAEGLITGN